MNNLKTFLFTYFHPTANQFQTRKVQGKNKFQARHEFWKKSNRKVVEIVNIQEI